MAHIYSVMRNHSLGAFVANSGITRHLVVGVASGRNSTGLGCPRVETYERIRLVFGGRPFVLPVLVPGERLLEVVWDVAPVIERAVEVAPEVLPERRMGTVLDDGGCSLPR